MVRKWLTGGLVVVAVAALLVTGLWFYFLGFSPDRQKYPVRGIDVSHQGGDHVDTRFAANLAGAADAKLAVGAYHFFTFCRPGREQAANFLAVLPRDRPMLPPVVDIEYLGNCDARPSPEELRRELADFIEPVEAALGRPVMFYLVGLAYFAYRDVLPERMAWVRWLALEPFGSGWTLWQYHDRGRVDGIEGDVDLNVFSGTAADLAALVK